MLHQSCIRYCTVNMYTSTLIILLFAGAVNCQGTFLCPAEDGYYGDPGQCDKYYDCYRGSMEEKLCPDGLMFDRALGPRSESCNYPFLTSCPEGSVTQQSQSASVECPRLNGYFEHEDPSVCNEYYQCTGGSFERLMCSTGLVFDELTGTCQWAHTNIRTGCVERRTVLADGFTCDGTQQLVNGQTMDHTRHPKPDNCRDFYVCQEGIHPVLNGCPIGTVFNDHTLMCDAPENVPGCEHYYDIAA